jgi:Ca2+-binding EF-hand superfamily protein
MIRRILCGLLSATAVLLVTWLVPGGEPTRPAPTETIQDLVFLGESRPILVRLHIEVDGQSLQAAYDASIDYLFRYLDVDGDGVLSKEEAERAPTVEQVTSGIAASLGQGGQGGLGRGRPAPTGPTMQDLDTNRDGKVTRAELAAYYARNGFTPFQFRFGPAGPNLNGALAAILGGSKPEPSVEAVSKAIFEVLDTNKDGKLSREELAAAESVLLRLDEDQDEMILPRELVTDSPNANGLNALLAMGGAGGRRPAATSSPTLVPILTLGEVPIDLVKRLKDRYGKDADAKGLSRKDLGLDEAAFRALDTDGNGVLDDKELGGLVKRTPDLELRLRLGRKAANHASLEVLTDAGRSPLARHLTMEDGLGFLDLGLTRVEFRPDDVERADPIVGIVRQQAQTQFQQADKDHNGILDADEIQNSRFFRPLAKALDRKGDGKITEEVVNAYLDHLQELQKQARAGCVNLEVSDQSRGLFDMLDTDRDGRLSVREMRQAPKLLAKLDHANKGYLTSDDIPRSYRVEIHRGPSTQGGPPGLFDLYGAPTTRAEVQRAQKGPLWFRKMDRNRDGDVSRKEFLFGEELFRLIDTDGDGLISAAEAEKAAELLKGRGIEEEP